MIRNLATDNWVTFLFVILIGLLVLLQYLFPVKYKNFTPLFKKEQFYVKYIGTFNLLDVFNLISILFFLTIFSFLMYKLVIYYKVYEDFTGFLLFGKLFLYGFLFLLIRYFLGKMVSKVMHISKATESVLFYKIIILTKISFYLFPFIIIFHYYDLDDFYVYLVLVSGIILVYNYFQILLKNQRLIFKHLFYFILYLCTLEIAPLFIYLKIVFKV